MLGILIAFMSAAAPTPRTAPPPEKGKLVVVNQSDHTVLVVDPFANKVLGKATVGVNGHEVEVSHDGRYAYVPIYSNVAVGQAGTNGNHIDVVDVNECKVVRSINLGKDVRPHSAHFGRNGLLYVSAELDQALYAVDTKTDSVVAKIPSGQPETHMFVISKDGAKAYTSNISSGTVSVLDLKKHELSKVIQVCAYDQRISMSVDGRWVFTHDQEKPRIAMIDTKTDEVADWIDVPGTVFSSAPTRDGKWLLAVSPAKNQLYAIDLATKKVEHTFDLPGGGGMFVLVTPSGNWAFVSCIGAGKIAVIDLHNWQAEPPVDLSGGVDGLAWAAG